MDTDWLSEMQLFVTAAKTRNLSRAAAALGIPPSSVTRRLKNLEARIRVKLFDRNTRGIRLTEEGIIYYNRVEPIVEDARIAQKELAEGRAGSHLRVIMPRTLLFSFIPWTKEFMRLYPHIKLTIDVEWMHADLITERYDIAFHIYPLVGPNLTVHPLTSIKGRLYASSEYIATHPRLSRPEDLSAHDCLFTPPPNMPPQQTWTLLNGSQQVAVQVRGGSISVNDPYAAADLASQGFGVIPWCKATPLHHIESGRLVRVLPDWHVESPFFAITASRTLPARTKAFFDFIDEKLRLLPQYGLSSAA